MKVIRRKKELMPMILAAIFVLVVSFGLVAENPPAEVRKAAEDGLSRMMAEGVPGEIIDFADLSLARLEIGFPIYTVSSSKLQSDKKSQLSEMVTPTIEWYFIVKVNRKPIALMTVAFFEGKWTAVAIGDTGLSKEVTSFTNKWSKDSGFEFRFIRIFEAKADLLEIRKGSDTIGFMPFESARVSFEMDPSHLGPGKLLKNSDFIEPLRDIVTKVASRDFENQGIRNEED